MVCRSTPGNSAITSHARLASGLDDVQVLSLFHELRRTAPQAASSPTEPEWNRFLTIQRDSIQSDNTLSPARIRSLLNRLDQAQNGPRPDAATYYALQIVHSHSADARTTLDAHMRVLARQLGITTQQANERFEHIVASNRNEGRRGLATDPNQLAFEPTGLPGDRATLYALQTMYAAAGSPRPTRTGTATSEPDTDEGVTRCPDCGEFASRDHVCTARSGEIAVEAAAEAAAEIAAEAVANAPAATRQRTELRAYRSDTAIVRMLNLSQLRATLREQSTVRVSVEVGLLDAHGAVVSGDVDITDRGRRRPHFTDRYIIRPVATDIQLRCTCPQYRLNYDCPHIDQATHEIATRLNGRPPQVASAPTDAVADVRQELHADYQQSRVAQQAARAGFDATSDGVSYSTDMAAFQTAWDTAKARIATGDTTLPYLTENATGGLGARQGGRSFGIEIEVDFPDSVDYHEKQAVARELYEAGLAQTPDVNGWHHAARAVDGRMSRNTPQGLGYSDDPSRWSVEFDRSVDDVSGQRGCEIVSPIMYDEPQTWQNLAKVCEIVQRHGGTVTTRTGCHINVGASDFNHTVENHNRLLQLASSYEDVILRTAHNPVSGPRHRGRDYCLPSTVPASGYRRISDAQIQNSHRAMINLDHVPAEGQPITNSTRVEVRIFDGTVDPGRLQTNVKIALGLVNAAARGVDTGIEPEPAGTHQQRARERSNGGRARRLTGEAWESDTASARRFADLLFTRSEDKAQMVHAFAASKWQSR